MILWNEFDKINSWISSQQRVCFFGMFTFHPSFPRILSWILRREEKSSDRWSEKWSRCSYVNHKNSLLRFSKWSNFCGSELYANDIKSHKTFARCRYRSLFQLTNLLMLRCIEAKKVLPFQSTKFSLISTDSDTTVRSR